MGPSTSESREGREGQLLSWSRYGAPLERNLDGRVLSSFTSSRCQRTYSRKHPLHVAVLLLIASPSSSLAVTLIIIAILQ